MPRSVRIAFIAAFVLGLLGLGRAAFPHQQILAALHLPRSLDLLVPPASLLIPAITVLGIVRRDERARALVFWFGLGMAILIGLMLLIVAAFAVITPSVIGVADAAGPVFLVFGPYAALAWCLSRPSAKAWFTPTAVR